MILKANEEEWKKFRIEDVDW